ncbi:MAG: phosphate signaling complex protein PhoU [Nocardioidaceae bacterium]
MREAYYDQLDSIIQELVAMTGNVRALLRNATSSLLNADARLAEQVISADDEVDREREVIEDRAFELLAMQQPVAGDLRMLVAGLRMVADLERMGDLSVHIAKVARLRFPARAIPDHIEATIAKMGDVAERMVGSAAEIVAERDVDAARALEEQDDEMDQLRRSLFRTLLSDEWDAGVEAAIDIALLGRYYERIADHAVSMARRVVYLVTGEHPNTLV